MKMKQKITIMTAIFVLTLGFSSVFSPTVVQAQINPSDPDVVNPPTDPNNSTPPADEPDCQPGTDGCCGGVKTSIIGGELCGDNSSSGEDGTIYKLLINVLNILTAGIGIAAIGGIGYGALLYTTAESKPEQTKKAIGIITNVVIGIVAYGLMFVLLNFLIPGGVFAS